MLVISDTQDREHYTNSHVLRRAEERLGLSPVQFIELVDRINSLLPRDWRMTRGSNTFRLQVQLRNRRASLVGSTFLAPEGRVVHFVLTVLLPKMVTGEDVREIGADRLTAELLSANPHVLVPNLYYFDPQLPGQSSPLFARQHEKIKMAHGKLISHQYHRIHPVTAQGMSRDESYWIRWNADTAIEWVHECPPDFHAKSYWKMPRLPSHLALPKLESHMAQLRERFTSESTAG